MYYCSTFNDAAHGEHRKDLAVVEDRVTEKRDAGSPSRLLAVDALRGLMITLMALDHASYFVAQKHSSGEYWGGPFPSYHDPLAFLTRLVTHPVAPGFSFLMGVGIALFARSRRQSGWSKWSIALNLLIRGAVLIGVQLSLVNRAWELSPAGWGLALYFGVLVALGGGMVLASGLAWLRPKLLLTLALALLLGIELLTPSPDRWGSNFSLPISVLLIPGGRDGWWVNYPILQWLELVIFGLAFGHWLANALSNAFRGALICGMAFLLVFVVIRCLGGFGNIRPQPDNGWIGFLNVVKYPPSIAFTMMTMGTNLTVLGLFGWASERFTRFRSLARPLVVIGQVPLFFYVTHLFLYAGLGSLTARSGTSIAGVYPYWILGVLLLYPLCLWYGRLKQRQPVHSLLRFL